jgi:2-hydroxychromene-2-carboxylate isomerase
MPQIEFYFDFSSPNAYFAYIQLDRLRNSHEFEFHLKPVFLGGIMQELETTPPAMQNEAKARYLQRDLERWSNYYDIPFENPPEFPVDSLHAMRMFLVLEEKDASLHKYVRSAFQSSWAEERNLADHNVIESCLPNTVSSEECFSQIEDQGIKNELKERTDRALERGVFGCPMIYVDSEPFWGKDRMEFIEDRLTRYSN